MVAQEAVHACQQDKTRNIVLLPTGATSAAPSHSVFVATGVLLWRLSNSGTCPLIFKPTVWWKQEGWFFAACNSQTCSRPDNMRVTLRAVQYDFVCNPRDTTLSRPRQVSLADCGQFCRLHRDTAVCVPD